MKERLKTAAIWLLLTTALFLAFRTWVYDDALLEGPDVKRFPALAWLLRYDPAEEPERFAPPRWQYAAAGFPVSCVVYQDDVRRGASDGTAVREVYETLRVTLSEALNTASVPEPLDEAGRERLMNADSFYFQYEYPVSLSLLSAWLTVGSGLDASVRGLGLSFAEGECRLVFRDAEGLFHSAAAEVLWNGWPTLPALAPCAYAYETEGLPEGTPRWLPLTEDRQEMPLYHVTSLPPFSQNMADYAAFLRLLEIDSVGTPSFMSEDTRVYTDGNRLCRLGTDGSLQYVNPEAPREDSPLYAADSDRPAASRVERARTLTAALEPLLGDGRFTLASVREEEGMSVVEFTVTADNLPFATPLAYAVITVGDGLIRRADIRLARFERQRESIPVLPLRYALWLTPGQPPVLRYQALEASEGVYEPAWCRENEA